MTYKQISTVAFDDLSAEQVAWIKRQDMNKFVEITDGDESLQREIRPVALTLVEVLADAVYGQRVIFGEKPRRAPKGTRQVKAYYGGEYAYEVAVG